MTKVNKLLRSIWVIALLLVGQPVFSQNPFAQKGSFQGVFTGKFTNETVRLRLVSGELGYSGTLRLAQTNYEVQAKIEGGKLVGFYFSPTGKRHPLRCKLTEKGVLFERSGGGINLKKEPVPDRVWGLWESKDIRLFLNQEGSGKQVSGIMHYGGKKFGVKGEYQAGRLDALFQTKAGKQFAFTCEYNEDEEFIFSSAATVQKLVFKFNFKREFALASKNVERSKVLQSASGLLGDTELKRRMVELSNLSNDTMQNIRAAFKARNAMEYSAAIYEFYDFSAKYTKLYDTVKSRWLAIDSKGEWHFAGDFKERRARIRIDDKYGFMTFEGKLIIPCKWDKAGDFSDGLAWVVKSGKAGFIDTFGRLAIPLAYDEVSPFSGGLAKVSKSGKQYFIDKKGRKIFDCRDGYTYNRYRNGYSLVKLGQTSGYLSAKGEWLRATDLKVKWFSQASSFSEDIAAVKHIGSWIFIDTQGEELSIGQYEKAGFFSDGLCPVLKGESSYFIDTKGNKAFEMKVKGTYGSFHEGVARVTRADGQWLFVNKKGKVAIGPLPGKVSDFSGGYARFSLKNGHFGYVNLTGEVVVPPVLEYAGDFSQGMAVVKMNGNWAYVSAKKIRAK